MTKSDNVTNIGISSRSSMYYFMAKAHSTIAFICVTLVGVFGLPHGAAQAQHLRVISLNIGAALKHPSNTEDQGTLSRLFELGLFLKQMADESNNTVIGLQEVDNCLERSLGINQAGYLAAIMGAGWKSYFQRNLIAGSKPSLTKYAGATGGYINDCANAGYGIAVLSNVVISKVQKWTYAWDAKNTTEYGDEQMGIIATKLSVGGHPIWLTNTHLSTNITASERQVWQLIGNVGRFSPSVPVIVVGDFNIRKDGVHTTSGVSVDHKRVYERMTGLFDNAGFVEIGKTAGYTFKPINEYSKLDYVFLYSAGQTIGTEFQLRRPVGMYGGQQVYYTDHKALVTDLQF